MTRAAALAAAAWLGWALSRHHARRPLRQRLEQLGQAPVPAPPSPDPNRARQWTPAEWAGRDIVNRAFHGGQRPEHTP